MTLPLVHLLPAGKEDCTCWAGKHDQGILRKISQPHRECLLVS